MASDGIVWEIDEDYLEETNSKVLLRHNEKTGERVDIVTNPEKLAKVFPKVKEYGNTGNREEDLILKATAIMAAIPWLQAFWDGNRRTSIVAAGTFLRNNGYQLDISPEEENTTLRRMLSDIKLHQRDIEPIIFQRLFLYVTKRTSTYEPKTRGNH